MRENVGPVPSLRGAEGPPVTESASGVHVPVGLCFSVPSGAPHAGKEPSGGRPETEGDRGREGGGGERLTRLQHGNKTGGK